MKFGHLEPKAKIVGLANCTKYVENLLKSQGVPSEGFSCVNYQKLVDSYVLKYLLNLDYREDGFVEERSSQDFSETFEKAILDSRTLQ